MSNKTPKFSHPADELAWLQNDGVKEEIDRFAKSIDIDIRVYVGDKENLEKSVMLALVSSQSTPRSPSEHREATEQNLLQAIKHNTQYIDNGLYYGEGQHEDIFKDKKEMLDIFETGLTDHLLKNIYDRGLKLAEKLAQPDFDIEQHNEILAAQQNKGKGPHPEK